MDNGALIVIVLDVIVGLVFVFALIKPDVFVGFIGRYIAENRKEKICNNLHDSAFRRKFKELLVYHTVLLVHYCAELFCAYSGIKIAIFLIFVILGLKIFFQTLDFACYVETLIMIFVIDVCWEVTFVCLYATKLDSLIFFIEAILLFLFNAAVMVKAMKCDDVYYFGNVVVFLLGYFVCKSFIEISFCINIDGEFFKAFYNVFDGLLQSVIPACVISYIAAFINKKGKRNS